MCDEKNTELEFMGNQLDMIRLLIEENDKALKSTYSTEKAYDLLSDLSNAIMDVLEK